MSWSFTKFVCTCAALTIGGLAVYTLTWSDALAGQRKKREDIRQLEKRNAELAREIELRRQRIRHLEENPDEQELEIRRQMKLVRPDEKVFILQDQPAKTAP